MNGNLQTLSTRPRRQAGMAMLVALIMLVVMTLLALSAVRFSALEVKMSSNDELIVEAFQKAVSIVDATIANSANTAVTSQAGYTVCTAGVSGCNANTVVLPDGFESSAVAAGKVTVKSILINPQQRMGRGLGSGIGAVYYASFRIEGSYDRSDEGLGRDAINEGVAVLLSGSSSGQQQ